MIDLRERINENMFGRIYLATLPDDVDAALMELPIDADITDPYLVAIIQTDCLESIARTIGLEP